MSEEMKDIPQVTEQASKQKDERLRRILLWVSVGILAASIAGMVYCGVVLKTTGTVFRVIIGTGLAVFWLLNDVIAPIVTHETAEMTQQQRMTLWIGAACDFVGYAGLGYFCFALDRNSGFYGVVVYAVATMVKRRFQNENKETKSDDGETAADQTDSDREEVPSSLGTAADRAVRMAKAAEQGAQDLFEQKQSDSSAHKMSIRELAQMNTAELSSEEEDGTV